MRTHGDDELLRELRDEADLCANEGVAELAGLLNAAADRLGQLLTPPAAPMQDDWILVPVTPTNDMTAAMADALEDPENERSSWDLAENMWHAMLPKVPTPPAAQRQWVGLTDAERGKLILDNVENVTVAEAAMFKTVARAIEAKLKEKNT